MIQSTQGMTDREQFCAVLDGQPTRYGEAIIVLCGQDEDQRAFVGVKCLRDGAAPMIVLTGHSAPGVAKKVLGCGVAPDRILIEDASHNTREQAVNTVALAMEHGWTKLILVASPYHMYRAYLTFLQALNERGVAKVIHLMPVPATQLSWWGKPIGCDTPRAELLGLEFEKIDRHGEHVASYADGVAYLKYWEVGPT